MMKRIAALVLVACLAFSAMARASVPTQMTVQGRLLQSGAPMNGSTAVTFRLFDAITAGTQLWTEDDNVNVQNGVFTAVIGQTTPLPYIMFSGQALWLETVVGGTALTPRLALVTVPYSFRAQRADTANVALSGASGNEVWSSDGTNVWRSTGRVGIGTDTPGSALHVLSSGTAADFQETAPQALVRFRDQATVNAPHIGSSGDDFVVLTGPSSSEKLRVLSSGYLSLTSSLSFALERFTATNTVNPPHIGASGDNFIILAGPSTSEMFRVTSDGNVGIGTATPSAKLHVVGDLCVTGQKNRLVETSRGQIKMQAEESAEALFHISGQGQLKSGRCHIDLDPLFLETVTINRDHAMSVWITFYGPHGDYYVERGLTGFDLIDSNGSNAKFDWKVEARQRGYENVYLQPVDQTAKK